MKQYIPQICPHCFYDNSFEWDIEYLGYIAHCNRCGEAIKLCNMCDGKCDLKNGLCKRNRKEGKSE